MEHIVEAVVKTASSAMAQRAAREEAEPLTLKGAVNRVRLANKASGQWHEILREGIGFVALARDEASALLSTLLTTPLDAVWYAALMRTSPRDEGLYPGYFPGYYKALTGLAARTSVMDLFRGFTPTYIHHAIQNMRPSQVVSPRQQDVDLEDWTSINNAFLREALRWVCYTAAHPFFVVSTRMKFYAGPAYSGVTQSFRTIIANEGWTGLFKGHSIAALETLVAVALGEQYVAVFELFYPLEYLKTVMALDTQHLRDPLTAANAVYREGGFKRFFAGGYAAMWSLPWELMIHAASEGIMLLTFGFKQHRSPRTVPQRARTALRRWFFGEREDDRGERLADFKKKHGTVEEIMAKDKGKAGDGAPK